MENVLISVCVPTFNYGRFLANCIRSVQAQSHRNWELIITDDRSDDGSEAICRQFEQDDVRIHYHRNPRRFGVYGNLARAVGLAQGSFVKILCSDDWLHPDCLAKCLTLASSRPNIALVCTNCVDTDIEGRPLWSNYVLPRAFMTSHQVLFREALGYRCVGGNSSYFLPRHLYQQVGGYDTDLRYVGDYLLALKLCSAGDFVHTNEPLFYGRRHESQSSVQDPKSFVDVSETFIMVERFHRFAADQKLGRPSLVHTLAALARIRLRAHLLVVLVFHFLRGRTRRARGIFSAIPVSPAEWVLAFFFLPVSLVQAGAFRVAFYARKRRLNATVIKY